MKLQVPAANLASTRDEKIAWHSNPRQAKQIHFTSCPLVFCTTITLHEKTSPLFWNLGVPIHDSNVAWVRMVVVAFGKTKLARGWPLCLSPGRHSSPADKEGADRISCWGKLVYSHYRGTPPLHGHTHARVPGKVHVFHSYAETSTSITEHKDGLERLHYLN